MSPATESEKEIIVTEAPALDFKNTSDASNANQESLQEVPSARNPWVVANNSRPPWQEENVGRSESGPQSGLKAIIAQLSWQSSNS